MASAGEKYYRDGAEFIIDRVEGNFVIFTSGARCQIKTLNEQFTTNQGITENMENQEDDYYAKMAATLTNGIDLTHQPAGEEQYVPSVQPSSISTLQENVTAEEIKRIDIGLSPDQVIPANNEQSTYIPPVQKEEYKPEIQIFRKLRRTEFQDINVTIRMLLPKPAQMEIMNDMFQSTTLVEFLTEEVLRQISSDNSDIKASVIKQLEKYMTSEIPTKTKVPAKPRAKVPAKPRKRAVKPDDKEGEGDSK